MLLPSSLEDSSDLVAHRTNGTTRFVPGPGTRTVPALAPESFRATLPELAPMRLIKTDTDGFDARLLPGLAHAYADTSPVLFFEFDPRLARETGDLNPERIWDSLMALGYDQCVVWNNFGVLLGSWPTSELPIVAGILEQPVEQRGYHYWDVAAIHREDRYSTVIERALLA